MSRTIATIATCASLCLSLFWISPAQAQGLLIASEPGIGDRLPRPIRPPWKPSPHPRPQPATPGFLYDIARLEIDASIQGQIAQVQVDQTFKNVTSRTLQVKFVFPLPDDGAIDEMTFMVDGEELTGRLLEADKAREIYEGYVRRSKDPALVQWIGHGMFQTQVFPVPPGAERTVTLQYSQICRRSGSMNDWTLPLAPTQFTSQPIGEIVIRGRIRSDAKLGNVYSPTHEVDFDRRDDHRSEFKYTAKKHVPESDFRVLWEAGDSPLQMSLITHRPDPNEDGYFLMLLQPSLPESDPANDKVGKNIVVVVDKSGSMRGEKIEQARRASRYVVDQLKPQDRFTLITYDSDVNTFNNQLIAADPATRDDATDYIDSILAGGSTNIDAALSKALAATKGSDGPAYVVFMSDGQPTVGEKNGMKIADKASKQIASGTRLFSLGIGHDVNSRLLDKLAEVCFGQTMYVRPGEPLDDVVKKLYDRIGAPALTGAKLEITVDGRQGATRMLYPSEIYDLFSGDQLVIAGRYRRDGDVQIKLTGEFEGESQEFVFDGKFAKQTDDSKNVFVERLWATRRIGQIIDEIDLYGEQSELVDELILLSKKHGILTPYTAYLAEEKTDLNDRAAGREQAQVQLHRLRAESGADAFHQRSFKSQLKQANRGIQSSNQSIIAPAAPAAGASQSLGRPAPSVGNVARPGVLGGKPSGSAIRPAPNVAAAEPEAPHSSLPRVKQIATKTFYLKNNRYVDAEATKEQIEAATKVTQFSDAYFGLLDKLGNKMNPYLTESVEILVIVDGKPFLILP
ncbi:VIT domain-containing protein [Rosistilla oblonga]|uniref:VIT domain-containing protein n=1 Tax=Rosistilla oblonga TaxID=2527990 RepID=UPI003A975AEE